MNIRRAAIALAAPALGLALLAAPATAAPAADKDKTAAGTVSAAGPYCSAGNHCVFITSLGSASRPYFNSDNDFTNDTFSDGSIVNDNVWSASNSSTGNYESHYYYNIGYGGGLVFCVNPGSSVNYDQLTDDDIDGNGYGQRDEISSLRLRPRTSVRCF